MSVKGGAAAPLRADIGSMNILDISPDGSEFLLVQSDLNDETQRGTIWTMPVLGGAGRRLGNVTARGASYSPDGKLIAFNENESVYVCDVDGQNTREIWNTHHMVQGNPAFSPDSKRIRVTVSRSNLENDLTRIWELNVDGGNPHLLSLPDHWSADQGIYGGIWTPGGKHFVFSSSKDGPNNLYEYIEPRWYQLWGKPYALKLTSGQPEVVGMAPSRDGRGRKGKEIFALSGRTRRNADGCLAGSEMAGLHGLSARLFVALQGGRQRKTATHRFSGTDAHMVPGQQMDCLQ
jgi:dipeptidyl aminopeptidase/acylaminoacyl peptidase